MCKSRLFALEVSYKRPIKAFACGPLCRGSSKLCPELFGSCRATAHLAAESNILRRVARIFPHRTNLRTAHIVATQPQMMTRRHANVSSCSSTQRSKFPFSRHGRAGRENLEDTRRMEAPASFRLATRAVKRPKATSSGMGVGHSTGSNRRAGSSTTMAARSERPSAAPHTNHRLIGARSRAA